MEETNKMAGPACGTHDEHHHEHAHHHSHESHEHHHDHAHCAHHHEDGCCCHEHHHEHGDACGCGHDHNHEQDPAEARKELMILAAGAALLGLGLGLRLLLPGTVTGTLVLIAAFILVALDIAVEAVKNILRGDIFGESFLMTIAGIGAACIGEIPEGILVFLLYRLGEYLQTKAVSSSRKSISALLDVRPDHANLLENGKAREVAAADVEVGQTILVRAGEKIPLDGVVLSGNSQLDTAALTGESMPRDIAPGQPVMAGCINLSGALELRVEKTFGESTASKILEMVEHASEKKSTSEKFITRFARIYTPVVCLAAVAVAVLPPLAGLMDWSRSVYSALCFLAISCPCALVISVPLSFFAGIGRASREGILVKGGNYLETLANAEIVAFDKTGTLTQGRFTVSDCIPAGGIEKERLLRLAALAESRSTHPIAQSILTAAGVVEEEAVTDARETAGHGVAVTAAEGRIMAGKQKYLAENGVDVPDVATGSATAVYVALDGVYQGAVLLRDAPKPDAAKAISALKALGVRQTVMLSGDSQQVAEEIGRELGLDTAIGQLLPEDKLHELEWLRGQLTGKGKILYAGDGINDTPVLAAADIGIAMGGLGADAAIETADVVIMGDEPQMVASGIRIARRTSRIASENIAFSIAVKILVMVLSVFGLVELWAAVFADVGVCMLCILNTLRINRRAGQ
ncbi:MAG: cadmium-translocating P-type ATPase [Oscillospiraceae bacterium]|nr:cadmium-translocating P-type ATPase [Oscillospiraceae bacterium]